MARTSASGGRPHGAALEASARVIADDDQQLSVDELVVLVSYGLTVKALQDFLPTDTRLNATSVRRGALRVARRLETELGPEPVFPLAGCPGDCASLPPPPEPITVGIDGGYLRYWWRKSTHVVAILGEAVPRDGPAKRLGCAQSHDPKPRRHVAEVLRGQGLRHHQELVFRSGGEDSLRYAPAR